MDGDTVCHCHKRPMCGKGKTLHSQIGDITKVWSSFFIILDPDPLSSLTGSCSDLKTPLNLVFLLQFGFESLAIIQIQLI